MRVKLKKGYQQKLIEEYKNSNKLSWTSLAKKLNVSRATINSWYNEKYLLPSNIFQIFDKNKLFKKYIEYKKKNNWGQSKGGINSPGSTITVSQYNKNPELAEFFGILLGDGNILHRKNKKIGVYMIRIAGDAEKDKDFLCNYTTNLIKKLFNLNVKTYIRENTLYLIIHSINLVKIMKSLGFPAGKKINNQVTIPPWIFNDTKNLKACLRGLIDTDGSIYELKKGYLQLNFTNRNRKLLEDTRKGFKKLGFKISQISGYQIYLTRQAEIGKFYKEIGFSNLKHKNRYIQFTAL